MSELRLYTNAAMAENLAFYPRLGYAQAARRLDHGVDRVYFSKPTDTVAQCKGRERHSPAWPR